MKASKYRNVKTEVNGISFDSKKEAKRYGELRLLEKAGLIQHLRLQVKYPIVVNGLKVCTWIADFTYDSPTGEVVEDVKSDITRKNPVYRLKCKLVKAIYGISIREV